MELKERLLKAKDEIHGYKYSMPFNLSENDIETLLHGLHYLETLKIEEPDLPAPNTVIWWLCRIADPEIRRKAVGNVTNDSKLVEEEEDFENAIYSAFEWSPTEEGFDFWKEVSIITTLLSEPDFTEYNELRK